MTTKEQRELDEWIGNNVTLNFACIFEPNGTNNAICAKCNHDCRFEIHDFKHYTTDPAAAMEVLKKCVDKIAWSNGIVIDRVPSTGVWMVYQEDETDNECQTETLELAICLFAKKLFSK